MRRAVLLLPPENRDVIYGRDITAEVGDLVDLRDCCDRVGDLAALRPELAKTEIILSGWGMMKLDADFLRAAPKLAAVFYGAGSVRGFVTEEFWRRDILLTSAWVVMAIPVVEYTIAAIVFGLKRMLAASELTRRAHTFERPGDIKGLHGAKVGIIGAGMIGSGVLEKLKGYDVETFCYDPYLSEQRAQQLHTTRVTLEEVFAACDVVSLHAASTPETAHMIAGEHLRQMKDGAVFINTARGRIVREREMMEVLKEGKVFAFIDVTDPEPPEPDSPLYTLPNVFLTPHIAGPGGDEVRRQGELVLEELQRFLTGEEPLHPVRRDMMEWMA